MCATATFALPSTPCYHPGPRWTPLSAVIPHLDYKFFLWARGASWGAQEPPAQMTEPLSLVKGTATSASLTTMLQRCQHPHPLGKQDTAACPRVPSRLWQG